MINGGVGAGIIDVLDLTALTSNISVAIDGVTSASFAVSEIEQIDANSSFTNTIFASHTNNTWNINGENAGTLSTSNIDLNFSGFANLTGGNLNDLFNLNNADHITGLIDGGGGIADELNLLSLGRDITVQLGAGGGSSSSDTLFVNNIETINASSSQTNTIIGSDTASSWIIDSINSSTIETIANQEIVTFSGFNILNGGVNDDTFEIIDATLISQINGGAGAGNDSIDFSNTMADINIIIGDMFSTDGVNITGIEGLIGNNDGDASFNSTITVIEGDNTWTISDFDGSGIADGINDGQFQDANGDIINFIDFNILQGGEGIDIFNVLNGASITGLIHGGAGNDELRININGSGQTRFVGGAGTDSVLLNGGGSNYDATYASNISGDDQLTYTNTNADTYTFSYDEVESVQDDVIATNFTILGSTGIDSIEIATGYVSVNGATALEYSNRENLILSGSIDDTFDLVGDLNFRERFHYFK